MSISTFLMVTIIKCWSFHHDRILRQATDLARMGNISLLIGICSIYVVYRVPLFKTYIFHQISIGHALALKLW